AARARVVWASPCRRQCRLEGARRGDVCVQRRGNRARSRGKLWLPRPPPSGGLDPGAWSHGRMVRFVVAVSPVSPGSPISPEPGGHRTLVLFKSPPEAARFGLSRSLRRLRPLVEEAMAAVANPRLLWMRT